VRASRFRPTAEDGLASSNFGASGGRFSPRNTAELVIILIFVWIGRAAAGQGARNDTPALRRLGSRPDEHIGHSDLGF
jgi:hypothetical protein